MSKFGELIVDKVRMSGVRAWKIVLEQKENKQVFKTNELDVGLSLGKLVIVSLTQNKLQSAYWCSFDVPFSWPLPPSVHESH